MDCSDLPDEINEVCCLVTSDDEIRELNREFRGKDSPTDVLSFSQIEGEALEGAVSLGDIVVSFDTVVRQAEEYQVSAGQEFMRLLIHGVLHLMGYDHENVPEEEAERMRSLEDLLFERYESYAARLLGQP